MYDRICMIGSFLESAASWMVDKIIHCRCTVLLKTSLKLTKLYLERRLKLKTVEI